MFIAPRGIPGYFSVSPFVDSIPDLSIFLAVDLTDLHVFVERLSPSYLASFGESKRSLTNLRRELAVETASSEIISVLRRVLGKYYGSVVTLFRTL